MPWLPQLRLLLLPRQVVEASVAVLSAAAEVVEVVPVQEVLVCWVWLA